MPNRKFPFILSLICSFSLFAQNETTPQFDDITKIVYQYANDSLPGVAVGVVKDGEIVYENYIGYANLSHKVKVSEKTRFNIASNAKQYTALMILDLALKNKLSLEDDVRKYLPKLYPEIKEEIKVRHIINHSSGVRDYVELLGLKDEIWWRQVGLNNNDIMELMENQEELGFAPGSKYSYSNSGYILLSKIIEAITEEKFTAYSRNFFEEMGMNETHFVERYMGVIPNRAEPYNDWGNGLWLQTPTVTKVCGEGFLFTTLKDQMLYEQKLQKLENTDSLNLISQQEIPNSEIKSYGFGLELRDWSGRMAVHHSGATYGYNAQFIRFPEDKLSILVLSNNGNLRTDWVADSIASYFLPPIKMEKEISYDRRYQESISKNIQVDFLGQYERANGVIVRIVEQQGQYFWKKENGALFQIDQEDVNRFAVNYDSGLKIHFSQEGMTLFEPNGEVTEYIRTLVYSPSISELEQMLGSYYNRELNISFDLKLDENNNLNLLLSTDRNQESVEILSEKKFNTDSYKLLIEKDDSGQVQDILLSYDRAKNIRFSKMKESAPN